jgi:hypothetical protein
MKNAFRIGLAVVVCSVIALTTQSCAKKPAAADSQEELKKASQEEAKKIIVATVNGAPITMESLVKMMNRLGVKGPKDQALESAEELKKRALDRLILQELAYQKAKADGLKPEEKFVEAALANVKVNAGGEKEYKEFIEKQNLTEADLRTQVRRSLALELIYAREVYGKVTIPEETLKEDYEKVKDKYVVPEKVTVTDVVFLVRDNDKTSKKNMKKAKETLKKINADKDKNPWNLVLDGTFIVRNIDIIKDKDKELYVSAKKLKMGELSGVVKAPDSLHIIKLKDYSPERLLSYDEVKGSLEGKFRVQAQQKRLEEWERELRKDAKIEVNDVTVERKDAPAGAQQEKRN